jgi:nucleoside-diphosphate-sugar epimerase
MRVLVTGASGFVGRHCLAALRESGSEIHATARHLPAGNWDGVTWHAADLLDGAARQALLDRIRPTHLLHAAWFATPGLFWTALENVDWVAATALLAREFHRIGGKRLVAAGTCVEYAPSDEDCLEGMTPLLPYTIYGSCKHAAAETVLAFGRQSGLSTAWARLFLMYGAFEDQRRLVASVIDSLRRDQSIDLTDGLLLRDFLAGPDVGAGLVALLASDVTGAINIASGEPTTLRHVIGLIGEIMGKGHLLRFGARPRPPQDVARLTADVSRAQGELGWRPGLDLRSGLSQAIAWRSENVPL